MIPKVEKNEIFGLIRPDIDAHTLGIVTVAKLIKDCGYEVFVGDSQIARAVTNLNHLDHTILFNQWISKNRISRLGFSYRLDPQDAQICFGRIYHSLKQNNQFQEQGGNLIQIYFSGLPEACQRIKSEYQNEILVFMGDESPLETALKLGIPEKAIPKSIFKGSKYDDERMIFARNLIASGDYHFLMPKKQFNYSNFGTRKDSLAERVYYNRRPGNPPLMRVHAGPYSHNYEEAKKEFNAWLKRLAETKYLDIISIGSSQLSQSDFGKDWAGKPNGGGVPINSEQDLINIYEASCPMLVRTYAGTRNIPYLARVYERTINIAWHALSFWWFNQIDGRGPCSVRENLEQHIETLRYIAKTGKPFEPNIPHHFAFRGSDDYSYVLSAYLAAKTAKLIGVRYLVLQTMLNTPKYTWGIQDLAKARASLKLLRELEDKNFKVYLQPRAGLDYFSPDLEKAKIQLAAVSAMMDDIEPDDDLSPDMIHVVSYCEAIQLATPDFINESIQITTKSVFEYRRQKKLGLMDDMKYNEEIFERTNDLYHEVKAIIALIDSNMAAPYTAEGLYSIFKKGIMPVPDLWEGREEFDEAVKWKTDLVEGSVKVVDAAGKVITPSQRVRSIFMQ